MYTDTSAKQSLEKQENKEAGIVFDMWGNLAKPLPSYDEEAWILAATQYINGLTSER